MTELPVPLRVQGVTFTTPDPKKLSEFYQHAFNLPPGHPKEGDKDHLVIRLENMFLGFDKAKTKKESTDAKHPNGPITWFYVEDVDAMFLTLKAAGARVYSEVNREEREGQAMAVLFDPEDNMIGIVGWSAPPERRVHP